MKEWFKEKNNSSIYFTFIFTTITWNWKFFYALFLSPEQDILNLSSIDYALSVSRFLERLYFSTHSFIFDSLILGIVNFFLFFSVPALFSFLMIWYLPHVNVLAHKKSLQFFFKRKSEYDLQNSSYLENKNKETGKQIKTLREIEIKSQTKANIEKDIKSKESPEEAVKSDINTFASNEFNLKALKRANEIVYSNNGYYTTDSGYGTRENFIEPAYLSKLDVNGLISWVDSANRIEFTERGKVFLRHLDI